MEDKINLLIVTAAQVGLKIKIKKTKSIRVLTENTAPFIISNEHIEDVNDFCYLGSIITTSGGTNEDIEESIKKARCAFRILSKI